MMYVFLDWNLFKYYRPLHLFPFPYKWLIGPAFYFYIKNQFVDKNKKPFHKKEWLLFLPAIIYTILRLYWFGIAASEKDGYRITRVIVDSNYFRIQEFIVLLFNVFLGIIALRFMNAMKHKLGNPPKLSNTFSWLKKFVLVFVFINLFDFIIFAIDLIIHDGKESFPFLYPQLIVNVAYIYWIGFIGFTKPKSLFNTFKMNSESVEKSDEIGEKLNIAIKQDEQHTNANLTLTELASILEINPKDLSTHINEIHQMNFSEYLNFHRVEKVKQLLSSEDAKKYTLVTLAEEAGFSSKSSFNATFKKVVGMTPSAYRKQLQS